MLGGGALGRCVFSLRDMVCLGKKDRSQTYSRQLLYTEEKNSSSDRLLCTRPEEDSEESNESTTHPTLASPTDRTAPPLPSTRSPHSADTQPPAPKAASPSTSHRSRHIPAGTMNHPALLTPPATRSTPAPSLASVPETPSGNRTVSRTTESSSAPPTHLPPSSLAPSRRTREPTGRTGLRLNTTWSFNAEEGGKPLWSVWRRGEALRNPDTGAALEGSRWCSSTGR